MIERWSAAPFRPGAGPEDRALWEAYHAYRRARAAERAPGEPVERDALVEHRFLNLRDDLLHHRYAVIQGSAVISVADIAVARPDSPGFEARRHALHLEVGVLGPYRRRDIATNWLSLVREAMNLHGASRVVATVDEADGHGFARWLGASVARVDQEARCRVSSIDRSRLERWLAEGRRAGIRVALLDGASGASERERYRAVAEHLAEGAADRGEAEPGLAPLEALDNLRSLLEVAAGAHHVALAFTARGEPLGMAEAIWTEDAPARADLLSVGIRLPERSMRGGSTESLVSARALKAGLILDLLDRHPGISSLRAAHRGADEALLALDDRIGFRTQRILTTYTLEYAALVEKLEEVGLV